jgi:protein arginine kinase activator
MLCDNCGSGEAEIHLTQIVNNEMRTLHLCQACAAQKGVEGTTVPPNFPLADLLSQMGKEASPAPGGSAGPPAPCGFCGLSFKEFRDSGRLGCPNCWSAFEPQLRALLRRIHGSTQHVGKVYLSPDPSISERAMRLERLRRKLDRAVELEDFERAAELRDQIRALEPPTGRNTVSSKGRRGHG